MEIKLTNELIKLGYTLKAPKEEDFKRYYDIKKVNCERYVKKFLNVWNEEEQLQYNYNTFQESLTQDFFKSLCVGDVVYGYLGFSICDNLIGCVTMQVAEHKNRSLICEWFLKELIKISNEKNMPINMKVFKDNDDINIFKKFGFSILNTNNTHHLLVRKIKGDVMEKSNYEKNAKKLFRGKERKVILEQINNFYELEQKTLNNRKYKIGEDIVLDKGIYMTGFKANREYLSQISKEGKISGDYAGVPTRGGVKYAVSLWKFDKEITLHDYIVSYSGMTAVWGKDNYEFVPYGGLDEFAQKMKEQNVFCWFAESTKECRFLPSLARDTEQIALIFNMSHKECDALMSNDLISPSAPKKLRVQPGKRDPHNKEMNTLEDVFGARVAYPLFGIPRNCIEGIFVSKALEEKELLSEIKTLFPNCYICNLDGKVIVE